MSVSASEVQHPSSCCFYSLLLAAAGVHTDSHTCSERASEHHDGLPAFAVIKSCSRRFSLHPMLTTSSGNREGGREQKVTFYQHTGQEEVCVCVCVCVCVWWRNAFCFNNVVVFMMGFFLQWRRAFETPQIKAIRWRGRCTGGVMMWRSLHLCSTVVLHCDAVLATFLPLKKKDSRFFCLIILQLTELNHINKIQREEIRSSEQGCTYGKNKSIILRLFYRIWFLIGGNYHFFASSF